MTGFFSLTMNSKHNCKNNNDKTVIQTSVTIFHSEVPQKNGCISETCLLLKLIWKLATARHPLGIKLLYTSSSLFSIIFSCLSCPLCTIFKPQKYIYFLAFYFYSFFLSVTQNFKTQLHVAHPCPILSLISFPSMQICQFYLIVTLATCSYSMT